MPRRDGFPTNREIQTDITTVGHELLVNGLERLGIEDYPLFEGKPLGFISLEYFLHKTKDSSQPNDFENERLIVRLMKPNDIQVSNKSTESMRPGMIRPEYEDYYLSNIKKAGEQTMGRGFDVQNVVPSIVRVDYSAKPTDSDWKVHTSNLDARPSRTHLVTAKYFGETILKLLKVGDLEMDADYHHILARRVRQEKLFKLGTFSGVVPKLDMSPDLPLSGKEPVLFLHDYLDRMYANQNSLQTSLERVQAVGHYPKRMARDFEERIEAYQRTIEQTKKILEDKTL